VISVSSLAAALVDLAAVFAATGWDALFARAATTPRFRSPATVFLQRCIRVSPYSLYALSRDQKRDVLSDSCNVAIEEF